MRPAAFPTTDDIVALGNEVRRAPEIEIRESLAEADHELFHVLAAAAWRMQRILQENVRCSEFIDDARVPGVAPELFEPTGYDRLVFLFLRHDKLLRLLPLREKTPTDQESAAVA